jgi:hypothetical protein
MAKRGGSGKICRELSKQITFLIYLKFGTGGTEKW